MSTQSFSAPLRWSPDLEARLFNLEEPFWVAGLEPGLVWANRAALRLWGAADLAALSERPPEPAERAPLDALASGGSAQGRWTRRGSEAVETLMSALLLDGDGRGVLCHALRPAASDAKLRAAAGYAHTASMVTLLTPEGAVLLENPAARAAYGPYEGAFEDGFAARFADPAVARAARGRLARGESFESDVRVRTRRGARWHAMHVRVIEDPATGRACWVVDEQDITLRKQHEEDLRSEQAELEARIQERTRELQQERDFFEAVFDTVSALILVVDASGRITSANACAKTVFHGGPLVGAHVAEVCGFPAKDAFDQWLARGLAPAEAVEIPVETPSGRRTHILWTCYLERRLAGYALLMTGVEVTELRDAETKLQVTDRMATMGTLAAGVAHDLNNPLAYVITNSELVLEELDRVGADRGLKSLVSDSIEGARRAARIVEQLQTFAQGGASGTAGVAHVRSVVDFAARIAHNHVKLRAQVEVDCPEDLYVIMEENELGQVVLNLLLHAAEAIAAGEASRHHIRLAARAEDGWATLAIENDGPGVAPDELRRLFDPYSAAHTPPHGFRGLGLAISHRLITAAGGSIAVDSAEGSGTRVQVSLRLAATPLGARPSTRQVLPAVPPAAERRPRILVVDDEERLRAVVRRALRQYDVEGAGDGREALGRIEQEHFDLILCDVMMPEMTGAELHRVLSETRPEMARRMVFLSGGAFTPETSAFLSTVRQPVIDKPFRMDELRAAVKDALSMAWASA